MELINKFSRRNLSPEEVYSFSVILCDNEIDRDFERFSTSALNKLAKMFIGKTGVFDHIPSGSNQTARIFYTEVISDKSKLNSLKKPYTYILAKAYMVRSNKNKDLIMEIDAGIKKEVSVGCSIDTICCSICSKNLKNSSCSHSLGQNYNGSICHAVLDNPVDAYEWSFVAIPSQLNAGVIKSKSFSLNYTPDIINSIKSFSGNSLSLSYDQICQLKSYISNISELANIGKEYINDLKSEIIKLSLIYKDQITSDIFKSISDKLSINELKQFKKLFSQNIKNYSYSNQLPNNSHTNQIHDSSLNHFNI